MLCPKCGESVYRAGNNRGAQRYQCRDRKRCKWHGTQPVGLEEDQSVGVPHLHVNQLHEKVVDGSIKRYVITSAQNATPVWKPFFDSLLSYCKANNAQLVVIPYRYKNPTSMWSGSARDDDWWAEELYPYLYDRRTSLCKHLMLLGDIKTQPTASDPLMGFETMTAGQSAIVGHPKLEFVTVPTPQQKLPKILTTTGAVTKKNYIPSKAGKKGEFHHTFGACVVELGEGESFFIRQINAVKNGSFCELRNGKLMSGFEYRGLRPPRPIRIPVVAMGDTHVRWIDPNAKKALFAEGGIVQVLKPGTLVWHDVLDFHSGMHHHDKEVFVKYAKYHARMNNVEAEIDECFKFIDDYSPSYAWNVFVYSNHPDMLARWVKSTDPRNDPENCVFWAQTFEAMCRGTRMVETGSATIDPFSFWAERKLKCFKRSKFLGPNESYQIKGIEYGYHGHNGPSGSKGTLAAFTKIGTKCVIGHSHKPGIKDGIYQLGTSSYLNLEYQHGPQATLHTHCVGYPNGKRTLLITVNDKWHGVD